MTGPLPAGTAFHLAVLADHGPTADATVCAVLTYDGRGRRHLQQIDPTPCAEELHRLMGGTSPAQLQLPLGDELPPPTSAGRSWQTWVLPSIPPTLRTLPPQELAAALADQLLTRVAS